MIGEPGPGSRFRAPVAVDGPEWHPATQVFGEALDGFVAEHARARQTDDLRAAASLFFAGFANQITGPVLAELFVHGRAVTPALAELVVHIDQGRIDDVAVPAVPGPGAADDVRTALLDDVFAPVVATLRARYRVGLPVLWGNVAGAASSAARALSWWVADPEGPHDRFVDDVERLLDADPRTEGRARQFRVEYRGRSWHGFDRRTCCLAYRTAKATYCASCLLVDETERHERLLTTITTKDDEVHA